MDGLLNGMLVLLAVAFLFAVAMLYRRPSDDLSARRWHVFYTFRFADDGRPEPYYVVGTEVGLQAAPTPMRLQATAWQRISNRGFRTKAEAERTSAEVQRLHRESIALSCAHPGPKGFVPAHRSCDSES